jgi:hypothetical protein
MTPALDQELEFIVQERLQFKTILLKPSGLRLPKEELGECAIVDTDDQVLAKLKRAFESSTTLPSDHRPVRRN